MIPLNRVKASNKVDIWDMGPARPEPPAKPAEPDKTKLKGADLAAAEVEFEDAMERYKDELRGWTAAKKAHKDWHDEKGGPRKIELWAVDAVHAMSVDPERFRLDLPKGQRPGREQIEADERAAAENDAMLRMKEVDPQFGTRTNP
jgi:hypothetical protein